MGVRLVVSSDELTTCSWIVSVWLMNNECLLRHSIYMHLIQRPCVVSIYIHLLQRPCYHVTNKEVHAKIQQAIGPHEDLLTIVKRCKLQWYGQVSRSLL